MAMSGGQSVVDLLLKIYVLPKRSTSKTYPASPDRRKWLTLVFASLTFGIILAYTSFPGLGGRKIEFQQPSFPERQVKYSGDFIYCLTGTVNNQNLHWLGGQASIAILYSLQMPSLLILADLERYAAIEKVPVWPP